MKAIGFKEFGDSSVLEKLDVPTPEPKAGEVLVRIRFTSVNPVDWKIREGYLQSFLPHRFPIISGWDAAGEVAAVGESVRGFKVGDLVYAYTRLPEVHYGTYAEYIALPESFVAKAPKSVGLDAAASVPLVALTAYQALHEVAKVKRGDKVLVTGGAGGVGSFAIQFANLVGAEVTTTAGPQNQDYVKHLGAKHAVDYTKHSLSEVSAQIAPNGFDVVFDGVGGSALTEATSLLSKDGRLVSIVDTPTRGSYHFVYPNGAQLAEIAQLLDQNKLRLPELKTLSIRQAAEAQIESQQRHVRGKLVMSIDFGLGN